MLTNRLRWSGIPLLIVLTAALPASAQESIAQDPNDWAKKMFDSLSYDFGTVAKNAEVSHRFKVTNLYKQDVHIANVTTTCGCTAPKFDQTPVKSLESTYIDISMDTNRFTHEKSSSITVTFDQPIFGQVTIPVKVYIRSDLWVTPNSVNFGAVDQGASEERTLNIAYVGRPDWTIIKAATNNKHLTARVVQKERANGQVNYDLVVTLRPDAPIGNLRDEIQLITDDANSPQIPILVQARVEADVTVSPSIVQLGTVGPGRTTTRTVVLRGRKPFVIEKVECESAREAFKMPRLNKDAKPYHVLSLSFTAPKDNGPFSEKFIVTIKDRPEPLIFTARGTIESTEQAGIPR